MVDRNTSRERGETLGDLPKVSSLNLFFLREDLFHTKAFTPRVLERPASVLDVERDKFSTTEGRGEAAEIYQPVQRLASSHSPPKSQANT